MLKPIEDGPLQVRVWNPKVYVSDKTHKMPIITPAYPAMCATHNVTQSTLTVMRSEFQKAAELAELVLVGLRQWSDLFSKHDFFHRYRYYLRISATCEDPDLNLQWAGMVESRVRQLVMKLELVDGLQLAHPFISSFPDDKATNFFVGLELSPKISNF